jgi:hypothetical protein
MESEGFTAEIFVPLKPLFTRETPATRKARASGYPGAVPQAFSFTKCTRMKFSSTLLIQYLTRLNDMSGNCDGK